MDHLGETIAVHRTEHRSEADTAHAAEDDVESHVDLGVLTAEFLRSHVDAGLEEDIGSVQQYY